MVEVGGVGYLVQVPKTTFLELALGKSVSLFTSQIFREDSVQLFGFETNEQQELFDLLRSVTGVGPKTALNIISTLSPLEISSAVANDQSAVFEAVSGVGSKTAKLINLTLAGKLKAATQTKAPIENTLLAALQGLGWSSKIASPIVSSVLSETKSSEISELIRECLAKLSK